MQADWRTRYDLAVDAAHKAGDLARTYYESTFEVEHKADSSPVTVADKSAEKLIREALELDKKEKEKLKEEGKLDEVKENAAYLDSLGWVLYKQKKYKEALEYLKKAAADEDEGNHLEIWDHLADCHMALGQKKEAVAAWEKALKMEDISKRDGERRRKVSEKLRKVRAELKEKDGK